MICRRFYRMCRILLFSVFLAVSAAVSGADAGKIIEKNWNNLWKTNRFFWIKQLPRALSASSGGGDKLHYYSAFTKVKHSFFGTQPDEMSLLFKTGNLSGVEISVYNRGDSGNMSARSLNDLVKKISGELDRFAGERGKKESAMLAGTRIESILWQNENGSAQLKWSRNGDRAEFLSVTFLPPGEAKNLKLSIDAEISPEELKKKVQKTPSGGIWLDIPMVNQGAKGYCVAAVVARIMNYYGSDADQHIIANLAGTDAYAGTDIETILSELKSAAPRLNVRMKLLYRNKDLADVDGLNRLLNDYNSEARRKKARIVKMGDFIQRVGRARMLNVSDMFKAMDQESFVASRNRDKRKKEDFFHDVENSLRDGVPVAWINLGVDPEIGYIQHMRIINGIEPEKKQIIYTDSWGGLRKGKNMDFDRAWSITSAAFVLNLKDDR